MSLCNLADHSQCHLDDDNNKVKLVICPARAARRMAHRQTIFVQRPKRSRLHWLSSVDAKSMVGSMVFIVNIALS